MNQHHVAHTKTHAHTHDDFLLRFRKNLLLELIATIKIIGAIFRVTMALLIGIMLFVREFDFPKLVLALLVPPLFIYMIGSHFTLLSTALVISMTSVSIMSLFLSEQGDSFVDWFSKIVDSLFEMADGVTKPSSLSQKLMGFVGFSAIASLFIIFIA
jgi:hypothetical protein